MSVKIVFHVPNDPKNMRHATLLLYFYSVSLHDLTLLGMSDLTCGYHELLIYVAPSLSL